MNSQSSLEVQENRSRKLTKYSQTNQLMKLGENQLWTFSILGIAPMPERPVRLKDWLLVPAHQDSSAVPKRTLARIQTIYQAGIRPKGFVVVHEAPMQLPAPEHQDAEVIEGDFRELQRGAIEIDLDKLTASGSALASTVLKVAASAAVVIGSIVLPAVFFAGAALLDPILVAVTEDDVWIEIDRWWA